MPQADEAALSTDTVSAAGDKTAATRAQRWREKRQVKAQSMRPPEPGFLQEVQSFVAQTGASVVPHRFILSVPKMEVAGIHPVVGGLGGEAGITGGVLYEPPYLRTDEQFTSVEVLGSLQQYYGAEVLSGVERAPYITYLYGRYQHRPGEKFYGVGPGSKRSNKSIYRLDEGLFGGLFGRSFGDRVLFGGHVSYQVNRFGRGQGDLPQMATQFRGAFPGVGTDVDYLMFGSFFEFDSRDTPYERAFGHRFAPTESRLRSVSLDASRGFYLAAEVTHNVDSRFGTYDFTRFTLDMREFLPVDEELMHGFAFRQFASFTESSHGRVPFYRMQSIGGTRSLRGYSGGRFHGRNVVLVNGEVRCQVWHWLDMALFADAGQVFHRVETARFSDPHVGYGVGFRVKKDGQTLGRIDLARSEEGLRLHLDVGSLF